MPRGRQILNLVRLPSSATPASAAERSMLLQGWRESNPRRVALETTALPLSYTPRDETAAVGFEPTPSRSTAERSTIELRRNEDGQRQFVFEGSPRRATTVMRGDVSSSNCVRAVNMTPMVDDAPGPRKSNLEIRETGWSPKPMMWCAPLPGYRDGAHRAGFSCRNGARVVHRAGSRSLRNGPARSVLSIRSGRQVSNLRSPAPKAGALPTRPLPVVHLDGLEPSTSCMSRRRSATELQVSWQGGTRTHDRPDVTRMLCR